MWRYNTDGSLDTTFNSPTGYLAYGIDTSDRHDGGYSIIVDGSGKILVDGNYWSTSGCCSKGFLSRILSTGTLDTTFDSDGIVKFKAVEEPYASMGEGNIALDASGRILAGGMIYDNYDIGIWRFNTDGTLDTTLNGTGYVLYDGAFSGSDLGGGLVLDGSGRILVTGRVQIDATNYPMAVLRYNPDVTLDTTFGTGGLATHLAAAGGSVDTGRRIILDESAKIIVCGYSRNSSGNNDMAVWRFNPDGSLDTTFNSPDGFVVESNVAGGNGNDTAMACALDSSGRIVVTGRSINGSGNDDMVILRYK